MGRAELPDQGGTVRVIAGEFNGVIGPAKTFTPIHLFDISFKANGIARFELPSSFNTAVLILQGSAKINELKLAEEGDFVLFANSSGEILIEGESDNTLVIILSGEPINEPVFQQGPFVMNSREEITKAFEDFQSGRMGNSDF
jgi:redox-sensitive bicupin YhaK (pirin superfamily)